MEYEWSVQGQCVEIMVGFVQEIFISPYTPKFNTSSSINDSKANLIFKEKHVVTDFFW